MKTIHKISGIFLWCVVGVFLGKSVYIDNFVGFLKSGVEAYNAQK